MSAKSRKKLVIKLAFSALFFVILFRAAGRDFDPKVLRINVFFLVISLVLPAVMLPANAMKWKLVLKQLGYRVGLGSLVKIYLVGHFFSNILPSHFGGDVVRSYYVGRKIQSQSQAAVSVFVERLIGLALLLLLVILAPLIQVGLYRLPVVYIPAAGAMILLLAVAWLGGVREPLRLPKRITDGVLSVLRRVSGRLGWRFASRIVDGLGRFNGRCFEVLTGFHGKLMTALRSFKFQPARLGAIVILTLIFYSLTWLNVYASFRAFGCEPSLRDVAAVTPSIMFVAMMPVTVLGNLGFAEGVYVTFFGLAGIGQTETLAMSLLLRAKMLLLGLVGCCIYLLYRHRDPGLQGMEEAEKTASERGPSEQAKVQ